MFKLKIFLVSLTKQMWPKVTFYALLAVFTALIALFLKKYIPEDFADTIGADTVGSILTILASSMLAVTTFSLSTMVAAYTAASSSVTPRATQLITQDQATQNALSTFLGSFLFSLVGLIALNTGIYEGSGRFVIFLVSLAVIALILLTLIRWIEHLTKLGSVIETTRLVEKAVTQAIKQRAEKPTMGANKLTRVLELIPPVEAVYPAECGYVQYVDIEKLSQIAVKNGRGIFLDCLPGSFVNPATPLFRMDGDLQGEAMEQAVSAFIIGDQRSFEQDPRFGLCVLAEIASRALSSGDIDSGTAIDVIGRLGRMLGLYATHKREIEVKYPKVWVPELSIGDLFEDAFNPIARDGAGIFEAMARLQKTLTYLHTLDAPHYKENAELYAIQVLTRAEQSDMLEPEKMRLKKMTPGMMDPLP